MTNSTQKWTERFGTVTKLEIRRGKKTAFATMTIDCKAFTQEAVAFGDELVEKLKAAGVGANVWVKGPLEMVTRKNEAGNEYQEQALKVIYFSNKAAKKDAAQGETAEGETGAAAAVSETTASHDVASQNVDDEIPF